MKKPTGMLLTVLAFVLGLASSVQAASVTLVALDKTGDDGGFTGPEWRTETVTKPRDVDGDNVLGSDGWKWFSYTETFYSRTNGDGSKDRQSLPVYLTSISSVKDNWHGGGGWAVFDDPLNPGFDKQGTYGFDDDADFSITIDRATDQAFRLTVFGSGGSFDMTISVDGGGGAAVVTTPHIIFDWGSPRFYAYFDIAAGTDDVVVGFAGVQQTNDKRGLTGFALDSVPGVNGLLVVIR